jgi:serine/threonine-protein kinase HipA
MQLKNTDRCLITLEKGFEGYSPKGKRMLFGTRDCYHKIEYTQDEATQQTKSLLVENQTKISISGVQDKYSVLLKNKKLQLTDMGGTYILKPKPHSLLNVDYVPINEHLTMLIASSIYDIETAKCGLVLFENDEPAYVTKRFDVMKDGTRLLKEDFASVMQRTTNTHGKNYKYDGSYYEMSLAMDKYLPANIIEKEKFLKLILFNYVIGNGDAHIKNVSVLSYDMQKPFYQLAPAYDLLCTGLHIDDSDIALTERLYEGDIEHPSFQKYGCYCYNDFLDFGLKMGLVKTRVEKLLALFPSKVEEVKNLVNKSYLSDDLKAKYMQLYEGKIRRLRMRIK